MKYLYYHTYGYFLKKEIQRDRINDDLFYIEYYPEFELLQGMS